MPPRTKKPRIQKILFPTDFSGASIHAAGYALSLAEKYKARLRVVHVMETSREARGFYLPHLSFDKLDEEMRASAKDMLRKFVETRFKGFPDVETDLLEGEPYKEILKQVKTVDPDVVVMGTFGKARVDRVIFGSTTERVMRKSPCPVLVVPPPR
ncbi:MAG: universal stress protein [Thermodesulfobacteriota bacterium]|nr:MAG: universal stress protein [Thermodesulfobacteriota bacterium]